MKIKSVKKIKSENPINFYDITVDKYHNFSIGNSGIITHNTSLAKAISKLARPFGSALRILEGYGFFGSEVSPEPAAARYTSVKLSPKASEILRKYKHLFQRYEDGSHRPFWTDIPIGLTIPIVGIAVGYKTTILPRKLEDIQQYLQGKRKSVKPYFLDFEGEIKRYDKLEKAWLISSKIEISGNKIGIRGIPPIMKYSSVLKKLDWIFTRFEGRVKLINNSNTKTHIDIVYSGKDDKEWNELQSYINKVFSVIVTEAPIFIKDGQVLVYDTVEQYLDDYKWQVLRLDSKEREYRRDWTLFELEFNRAKKLFIEFILLKRRTVLEVDAFLKVYSDAITSRLEGMTSKKFTKDELSSTASRIKELETELKKLEKEYKSAYELFINTPDPTLKRGISSKKTTIDLFDVEDIEEVEGIAIWDGEDPFGSERAEDSFAE